MLQDGSVIVGSGRMDTINEVARLAAAGVNPRDIATTCLKQDDETMVHRFYPDGHIEAWCEEGFHPDERAIYLGNGEYRFLIGAMATGASAVEAVIAACWICDGVNFPVHVVKPGEGLVRVIEQHDAEASALMPQLKIYPFEKEDDPNAKTIASPPRVYA